MAHPEKRLAARALAIAGAIALFLGVTLTSATAVTGEVYTNTNLSLRTAEAHLLGATPRAPEVISASFSWNRSLMVLRIHVVQVNPYRRSSLWEVTQLTALDLFVNGREKMTDTITTSPGGIRGYSCGAHGTDLIGLGISRSYTYNTYTFTIPRSAFIKCGIRAGQVVKVLADSMLGIDNTPAGTNPPREGAWAAEWSPEYSFRL